MKKFILMGAGFSRNWGGWLASEAFEYLIGSKEVDAALSALLWKHKDKGGFEAALEELEKECQGKPPSAKLIALNIAVAGMFKQMDDGLRPLLLNLAISVQTA